MRYVRESVQDVERIERFIDEQTAITSTALLPELRLHLATEITPLWHASESYLAQQGVPPPFWAFAWAGGQALARWVLDHPDLVAGRRVLDFACGSGLVAIAAARAGARFVRATDLDPFAVVATRRNAALNEVEVTADATDVLEGDEIDADLILAGDVCYEQPMATRVTPWLRARAKAGKTVLVGDPGRAYLMAQGDLEPLGRYEVPVSSDVEGTSLTHATVFRLRG